MQSYTTGILAIAFYLTAGLLLLVRLLRSTQTPTTGKMAAVTVGFGGVVLHSIMLYPVLITTAGLNLGFFNAASLIGLIMALLLVIASVRHPAENLGIFVYPLAAISASAIYLYPHEHLLRQSGSWQLDLHILLSVVSYSLLAIAAVQSVVLAYQDRQLRNRHPGGIVRALPPLAIMENLLFQLISIGFALLTLALLSGIFFLEDIFAQHLVHKTVLSILAWLVFAVLLWGRWRFGWRGATAIRWTLGGFISLMLAYFGSKLVLELILAQ